MMTEPGPLPDEGGRPDESTFVDKERAGFSAAVERPSAPDDSTADSPVIDLRRGQQHPVESQVTPTAARPIDSVDPVVQVGSHSERVDPQSAPRLAPSRSVFALFLPAVVVVLVASMAVTFLFRSSSVANRDALALTRAVSHEQSVQLVAGELWSGVLALVAGGVGQAVVDSDQVLTLVGSAQSSLPGPLVAGSDSEGLLRAAADSHREFVASVGAALERADADPIALGNELTVLDQAHVRASGDSMALTSALVSEASSVRSDSSGLRTAALVVALLGLALAVLALAWARRRLVDALDVPADAIAVTLAKFSIGDSTARTRRRDPAGLGALAVLVDEDLDHISASFDRLHSRAAWDEQSRMIFEALDEAEDEDAAQEVIRRALSMIDEDHHPVELLLAERGSSRLESVAHDPTTERPGCPVDATGACVALRRGQVAVFDSSESINACPKLRDRPGGPCSAVCVPVTVATRPVGVLHMTGPEMAPPGSQVADRLVTLSVQIGNRLGALRALESSRKDASTDKLTGLPNRRKLESEVATLLERGTPFVMVLADLDKFKKLNDNFGHEIGDKALQLFSGVLRDNVRGNDVVSRLGGEEFVLVYPNMSVEISIEAIGRLRQALARAIAASRLPSFTCSFGVTHSDVGGDGDWILRVADAGLLRAKELGGDQAVFADADLAATVFSSEQPPQPSQPPALSAVEPVPDPDPEDAPDAL